MPISTIKLLENFSSYCAEKNKVISENIANIGTENYQRKDVVFKDMLNDNMTSTLITTDSKHIGSTGNENSNEKSYQIITDKSKDDVSGVNNVDIDKEMTDLAENTLNFQFAAKKISDYYKTIQDVIKGGGSA